MKNTGTNGKIFAQNVRRDEVFDIGKDLQNAYDDGFSDGYRSALQEVEYQVERLSKASWYSRGSVQKIIREEMKKLEKLRSEKVEN